MPFCLGAERVLPEAALCPSVLIRNFDIPPFVWAMSDLLTHSYGFFVSFLYLSTCHLIFYCIACIHLVRELARKNIVERFKYTYLGGLTISYQLSFHFAATANILTLWNRYCICLRLLLGLPSNTALKTSDRQAMPIMDIAALPVASPFCTRA